MSRKRAKQSTRRRASRAKAAPARSWAFRPFAVLSRPQFWLALVWIGLAVGAGYGLTRLDQQVRTAAPPTPVIDWKLDAERDAWLAMESWASVLPEIETDLELCNEAGCKDVYDPRFTEHVALLLAESPWVEQVDRVVKRYDGRIEVAVTFRKPFALVEERGFTYVVDRQGVVLPREMTMRDVNEHAVWQDWWVIEGVAELRPPAGRPWPGKDLTAGLALAEWLDAAKAQGALPFRRMLRSIHVGNFGLRRNKWEGDLQITTNIPGLSILWGLPPGQEYGVESTAAEKIARLVYLYKNNELAEQRQIDLKQNRKIDVRPTDGIDFR